MSHYIYRFTRCLVCHTTRHTLSHYIYRLTRCLVCHTTSQDHVVTLHRLTRCLSPTRRTTLYHSNLCCQFLLDPLPYWRFYLPQNERKEIYSARNLGIPTPPSTSGDIDPKIKSLVGPKKYVSMTFRTSLMDLSVMTRAKKFIYDIKLACKG